MAEIGIIASVIGVAGAGFRLSLILNAVGCEVAAAGIEIHTISKQVTLFSLMLKQVGQSLQGADSVHSEEAIATARQITDECTIVFDEIEEMLDRVQSRKEDGSTTSTIQQRFKWCFKKHRVTYLLSQLESLKLSLLVMLQILQLGKMLASTTKNDTPQDASMKKDMIQQERAETQNIVIVRYWQNTRLDRLYDAAEREDLEDRKAEIEARNNGLLTNGQPQLALEPPPDSTSTTLIKLPSISLGQMDSSLDRIRESPKDMVRVSDSVIDPLINRWTRWKEYKDRSDHRGHGRFTPSVHDLSESDEEKPRKFRGDFDRDNSPQGYYLEGTTTDWRKPHSTAARTEAAHLRKKYAGYQPSVDSDEEQREARSKNRRAPRRHVIDSSEESSSSSPSPKPRSRRRRESDSVTTEKRTRFQNEVNTHSYNPDSKTIHSNRLSTSSNATPQSTPRSSISSVQSPTLHRPVPHHSYTSPIPPIHTGTVPNAWAPSSPYSPGYPPPPPYPGIATQPQQSYTSRHISPGSNRMQPGMRPPSQDGKAKSPSRMPQHGSNAPRTPEDEKREAKARHKNMRKNATRGILGAGAIAAFLEGLEGLSI